MRTTKYPDTNIIWTCFDKGSGLGANVRIFTQMPKCVIFEPFSHFWSSTISRLNAGKIIHKDTKLFKKNFTTKNFKKAGIKKEVFVVLKCQRKVISRLQVGPKYYTLEAKNY